MAHLQLQVLAGTGEDLGVLRETFHLTKLARQMEARLPEMFATIPKTPLEIRHIPKEIEQSSSTNYSAGSLDGTRPDIY